MSLAYINHAQTAERMPNRVGRPRPLGRHLVEQGKITQSQLVHALEAQTRLGAPLGEILHMQGVITSDDIQSGLAAQYGLYQADLAQDPPDPDLVRSAPREVWIGHRAVPWLRLGDMVLVACTQPDQIPALRAALPNGFGPIMPVLAPDVAIMAAIATVFREDMTRAAETRVDAEFSCRHWQPSARVKLGAAALVALAGLGSFAVSLGTVFSVACAIAISMLFLITCLKLAGLIAQIDYQVHARPAPATVSDGRWPRISIMVPLFKETEIAGALIDRLQRLTYPQVLMDVILVLEEKDTQTRAALHRCNLPSWMRVVEVPDGGGITTKPRALNYALDFCRGEIIGIWDAEDAPAPDQLEQVAAHFDRADPDVVCLQGMLDYYNPRANWIARCFTIEYASWFRVILPGLARLGLIIPLGGTTLFLRRDKIHELGGWDAHNVTEDADLGVRIARFGYRTEIIATATYEEANCRPWRWVKQRSRWLKGFMVTYAVHMRYPRRLLRQVGWKKFLGFQAFFIGTLSQFVFAPLLWTFWFNALALGHPVQSYLDAGALVWVASLFMLTEAVNLIAAMVAVGRPELRFLIPWALTMPFYFPLGALASYKALYELAIKPFYWDKTEHGHSHPEAATGSGART